MTSLSELRFFTTPEHECSYLEDRQAMTLFADPLAKIDTALYSSLSTVGFRRSGTHIYRPYCQQCSACIPARIPCQLFKPRRNQRRIWRQNQDLVVSINPPQLTDEYFDLYERYVNTRHADGDMYPADIGQFESFLVNGRPEAVFIDFRLEGQLLAVAVADEINDGLSAIYTFFDPDFQNRSLGVFGILWQIEEIRRRGLDHVYLGYWIEGCRKMSYKTDYQPIELFSDNRWVRLAGRTN